MCKTEKIDAHEPVTYTENVSANPLHDAAWRGFIKHESSFGAKLKVTTAVR